MDEILDLLNSDLGKQFVSGTSTQLDLDEKSATGALSSALPLILGAMKNNAASDEGSQNLLGALGNSKHGSGGVLDNLGSVLGGDSIDQGVMDDGGKILGHLFGGQEQNAAGTLSKSSGLDMDSAMNLLKVAAPFIMNYLGKKTSQNNVSDRGGLEDMLGGLLGSQGGNMQSMASLIQGFDSNDSSLDDIAGALSGGLGSNNDIGSMLKGFLK